ncbi:MAG: precorrin-6A reductase [Syntrophaceae bacterium]
MILLLGGTSDTAPIATRLARAGMRVLVSLATDVPLETGAGLYPGIEERSGPLDPESMASLVREKGISLIVDATHPYAVSIRETARAAARRLKVPYLTYVRPAGVAHAAESDSILYAAGHEDAARIAFSFGRPVLLTTGSRNLAPYAREAKSAQARLAVRVLPHASSLQACRALDIPEENIVAGRGPFSLETNRETIRKFGIGVLVTKDSGAAGGVGAKIEAARREGCRVVIVNRPEISPEISKEGYFESIPEICDYIMSLADC